MYQLNSIFDDNTTDSFQSAVKALSASKTLLDGNRMFSLGFIFFLKGALSGISRANCYGTFGRRGHGEDNASLTLGVGRMNFIEISFLM